jgi:hypothetical protein
MRTVLMVPLIALLSARLLLRLLPIAARPVGWVPGTSSHGCASAWAADGRSEGLYATSLHSRSQPAARAQGRGGSPVSGPALGQAGGADPAPPPPPAGR